MLTFGLFSRVIDMHIYLQQIFSFCETAESKNKIHPFNTTVVKSTTTQTQLDPNSTQRIFSFCETVSQRIKYMHLILL